MTTWANKKSLFTSLYTALPLAGLALILAASAFIMGCKDSAEPQRATIIDNNRGTDPADANLAPVYSTQASPAPRPAPSRVRTLAAQQSYTPQQSSEQYGQPAAPIEYQAPNQSYNSSQPAESSGVDTYDSGEATGFEALADASQPPPPLPQYDQPPVPEPNDLWTPGYWNYAPQGYFWVPGAWVAPPYSGALWTPAYWGYEGNRYRLHRGFWARHIGFYGGINYGCGYTGSGYRGGYWNGNDFFYNRSVNHVNVTTIHNVYERNVTVNNITRVSYNGGNGGIQARPGPQELAVLHEQRVPPMAAQVQLREASAQNRQQFFNENHGRPAESVIARPIAAERSVQTIQPVQQQGEPMRPPNQALNPQRLAPEQEHPTPAHFNHLQPQGPGQQQGTFTQERPLQRQQADSERIAQEQQLRQQQNLRQQQSDQQHFPQQREVQQQADQQRIQQQQREGQQQADQKQRLQQQERESQQQADQQQRFQQRRASQQQQQVEQQQRQQQQRGIQQQPEQHLRFEQQRASQQQQAEQQHAQQQAEQQRAQQQHAVPPQQESQSRPQPPPQQQHLQPPPQVHPQAQPQAPQQSRPQAPRAEPPHR